MAYRPDQQHLPPFVLNSLRDRHIEGWCGTTNTVFAAQLPLIRPAAYSGRMGCNLHRLQPRPLRNLIRLETFGSAINP